MMRVQQRSQRNETEAGTSPITIPGAEYIKSFLLLTISVYLRAAWANGKFVPEIINPTAMGWLKPMVAKRTAE